MDAGTSKAAARITSPIRGPIAHFYPDPFVDVGDLGYLRVAVNVVGIAVLFLGLAALATVLDARLARRVTTPNH